MNRTRFRLRERYRAALAILDAVSPADRADVGNQPAYFPRVAREMSLR